MPLVFVHGVATRQTAKYLAEVKQRDALFRHLVLNKAEAIFDPDWGSNGVHFDEAAPWLPSGGQATPFSATSSIGNSGALAAPFAVTNPALAIDIAFQAFLSQKAHGAANSIDPEDLALFKAAVRYIEKGPDKTVFGDNTSDKLFLKTLGFELELNSGKIEPMAVGGILDALGQAMKKALDPIADAGSDAILRHVRRPLSVGTARFLGDIFVYLRWREVDGANGTFNRIFEPIIRDIGAAAKAQSAGERLYLIGHSLGGVILYDLLTDPHARAEIERQSGKQLLVDALVTVGSQPGLFADMKLYDRTANAAGKLDRPDGVKDWMNVFDYTDIFSFLCAPAFAGVVDMEFNNVSGVFDAHSAYFHRPSFFARLRERLGIST